MKIDSFDGRYRFLSNFHPVEILKDGIKYPSVEHYYVAMKINKPQWITSPKTNRLEMYDVAQAREFISHIETAGKVKRIGRSLIIREDWNEIKYNVMLYGVRQKFRNDNLKKLLLDTGDLELIEGNTWHDVWWGICNCPKCNGIGQNNLGKVLMQVRKEIRESEKSKSIF